MELEPEISTQVIRRSMAIKADVVSRDERETLGVRILLNYGHTIGHALESSTEYGRFMHGEGVAVGMMGAARIAQRMGMISQDIVDQQERLLRRFNLPVTASGVPVDGVLQAMSLIKRPKAASTVGCCWKTWAKLWCGATFPATWSRKRCGTWSSNQPIS